MNKMEKTCLKGSILKLASMKSTGTPSDMASKFEVSDRTIKRTIRELREEGIAIRYDYYCVSYVLEKDDKSEEISTA
jgi:DeoR/GlpR family transcriptional regulator of sugar metabolism